MAYGTVKVDNITFDNGGSDQNVTVSGLYRATTSGVTLSGTIAATTVSGVTVIGSTTVSGATVTGTTANFTSGNFSNIISSAATMSGALIMANQQQVRFREAVGNGVNHIALQAPAIVSADQTITLPDQTGTVITTGDNGSVSSTMLATNLTISAAAGSASTPSIAFTGDLNTGIYSPGADQLAISTGGTGQLFVDASGRVGVGTGSPSYLLTVEDNSTGIQGRFQSSNAAGAAISISSTSTNGRPYRIGSNYISGNGEFAIYDDTASATRLLIDSSGRVGIGTTSPGAKLELRNDVSALTSLDTTAIKLFNNLDGGSGIEFLNAVSGKSKISFGVEGSGGATDDTYLGFSTSANAGALTERLRIDSSGRVGIGTSSPGEKLHILTSSNKDVRIANASHNTLTTGLSSAITFSRASDGTADLSALFGWNNGGVVLAAREEIVFANGGSTTYSATAERLRIDSSGRLLVGTSTARSNFYNTSFANSLQIEGVDSSTTTLSLTSNNSSTVGQEGTLVFAKSNGGSSGSNVLVSTGNPLGRLSFQGSDGSEFVEAASIQGFVDGTPGANDMPGRLVFSTTADGAASPTERLRIDSSGRVGIGTSMPRGLLSISNNAAGTGVVDSSLHFGFSALDYYGFRIVNSNEPADLAAGLLKFQRGTVSNWIDSVVINNSGNVGIGTSSPAGALDVRTAGSAFQAYVGTNSGTSANDAGILFQNIPSATASSRSALIYFDANGANGSGGDYLYISNTGDNVASIWNQGGGPIVFGRVSTESLRIDSSGRLLVGTSSARSNFFDSTFSAQIQVEGSDSSNTAISQVRFLNDASGPYHILAKTRSASSGGTTIVNNDDVLGVISFQGADGSEFVEAANITCRVDGTPGANDMPGRLVFSTTADGAASPTERFRIDNAGQVLIGTTTFGSAGTSFSPIGAQVLHNNNTADTGVSLWCLSARPADIGRQFLYFQANTAVSPTVVFQVLNNGNTQNANGSFTSISDARLKENIVDSNSQWNDIKAIKIRNWNFKAETGLETHQQIGPVAQELELVCPGLVFEIFDRDADGNNLETATKGVNQSVLYMKAIKALQEAIARIETLEAAVAALQSA